MKDGLLGLSGFQLFISGSSRRPSDETGVKCLTPMAAPARTSAELFVLMSGAAVVVFFSSSSSYALCAFTELLLLRFTLPS